MTEKLINAIEASEPDIASEHFKEMLKKGGDPWEIHRSIFPVVQKVLNPPFINPHFLTGLGSTLWIIDRYGKDTSLVNNALFQYLDFFFDGIK